MDSTEIMLSSAEVQQLFTNPETLLPLIGGVSIVLSIMAFFWLVVVVLSGITLWKSARRNQKGWFIALLLFGHTVILPIIYLLVVRDPQEHTTPHAAV